MITLDNKELIKNKIIQVLEQLVINEDNSTEEKSLAICFFSSVELSSLITNCSKT